MDERSGMSGWASLKRLASCETLPASVRRLVSSLPHRFGWGEVAILAAVLVCAGGIYAFAEIVDDTLEGDTHGFDRSVLLALRNPADPADPIGPAWLEIMVRDVTALGGHTVIVIAGLVALGYLAILRKWAGALLLLVSLAGGILLNNLMKQGFDRPRPGLVAHLVEVQTASLPSGHAMLSAVAYLTLGALLARAQPKRRLKLYVLGAAVVLTLLIGVSRIYLGVHWPTDVLAGWCIGAAWAMACWLIMRFVEMRRTAR